MYVQYWNKKVRTVERIIFAENIAEVKLNGLKVFINDEIEAETGMLDDAAVVQIGAKIEPEIIE
jgi:hypothetical protein